MNGSRLLHELFGLLFLFCGLLMFLCLWTYNPNDPSFNVMDSAAVLNVQNAAGPFGSYLAGLLVDFFGFASYLIVLFFLVVGVELISRWIVIRWYRWIGYFCLLYCSVTLLSTTGLGFHNIYGGGFFGSLVSSASSQLMTPSISFFFWLICLLGTLELALNISLIKLTLKIILFFIHLIISLGKRLNLSVLGPESSKEKITTYLEKYEKRPRLHLDILNWKRSKEISVPEIRIGNSNSNTEGGTEETSSTIELQEISEMSSMEISEEEGRDSGKLALYSVPVKGSLESTNDAILRFLKNSVVTRSEENKKDNIPERQENKEEDPTLVFLKSSVTRPEQQSALSEKTAPSILIQEKSGSEPSNIPENTVSEKEDSNNVPDIFNTESSDSGIQGAVLSGKEENISESASTIIRKEELINDNQTETISERAPTIIIKEEPIHQKNSSQQEKETVPQIISSPPNEDNNTELNKIVTQAMSEQEKQSTPAKPRPKELRLPSYDLLDPLRPEDIKSRPDNNYLRAQGEAVISCLKNFHVDATLAKITPGPVITMFEIRPAPGVKATKITGLADDLAMSLKALSIRMQAPVPGSDTVGAEIPNAIRQTVFFREIIQNESFIKANSLLTIAIGKTTIGAPYCADLSKMPHLLVAGATGQGKSVCLNSILISLLYRAKPDEVQFILVDPKRVEFSMYADLPHLVHPVVTEMDLTKNALLWAVAEMERRMKLFSELKVKNIKGFNELQKNRRTAAEGTPLADSEDLKKMPYLVIVVDELGDLMMLKRKEVESPIIRLAQLGRAAGIHLIIATQRPSVDVVTGLIKVNFPCRIAFKVTSSQDSRTILDSIGAEKLLGNGDMLFKSSTGELMRIHGAFVSDKEVMSVVDYWKKQQRPCYKVDFAEFGEESELNDAEQQEENISRESDDPLYAEAIQFVIDSHKRPSVSLVQRRFRIGFNRAARLMEEMERDGVFRKFDDPNNQ